MSNVWADVLMVGEWVVPDEPAEAQPPAGVRLDDVFLFQGSLQSAVEVTYIDETEDDDDEFVVGPTPETVVIG